MDTKEEMNTHRKTAVIVGVLMLVAYSVIGRRLLLNVPLSAN